MKLPSLTLALTAFDEEANLIETVKRALEFLPTAAEEWELLIVDDGSRDKTRAIAAEFADRDPRIGLLIHDQNRGMGAAIQSAIHHARMTWFCTIAADGQVDPRDLSALVEKTAEASTVFSTYSIRQDGIDRSLLSAGLRFLIGILTGNWKIPTGNYMVPTIRLKELHLHSETFFVNYEIYLELCRRKISMAWTEIPCSVRSEGSSKIRNFRKIFKVAGELFRYRLRSKA